MKALCQRFHRQVVKQYKQDYFSCARKDLLELQEFQTHFMRILDNNQQLISLIQMFGYAIFSKHILSVLDERLYHKLYHEDENYFLSNLNFVQLLVQLELLPLDNLPKLVCGLSHVLHQYQKLSIQNIADIFEILQKILTSQKYLPNSLQLIEKQHLLPQLYNLIIKKQIKEYFFKLINFCRMIKNDHKKNFLTKAQKLHCIQIHILTSTDVEELYVSYCFLGQFFYKNYSQTEDLYEFASILDKTVRDIGIMRLIDPISFFLLKALNNHSLNKLAVEMGYAETIFDVILNNLMAKNNISIFGHHSIWCIFKKIFANLERTHQTKIINELSLENLKEKLTNYQAMRYPYVKMEVEETINQLENSNKQFFSQPLSSYEHIAKNFQDVQI